MNYVLTMASAQQRDSRHVTSPSAWLGFDAPRTCGAAGVESRQKSIAFIARPNSIETADPARTAGMSLLDATVDRPKGSPPRGELR